MKSEFLFIYHIDDIQISEMRDRLNRVHKLLSLCHDNWIQTGFHGAHQKLLINKTAANTRKPIITESFGSLHVCNNNMQRTRNRELIPNDLCKARRHFPIKIWSYFT